MNNLIRKNEWVDGKYTQQEEKAFNEFEKTVIHIPEFFNGYCQMEYGCYYDVLSCNITGGTEHVELKLRDANADKFPDCYIEPEKYMALQKDWRENCIAPLYVNFIGDWKNVYIWFLPQLKYTNFHANVKVKSDNDDYEIVDRIGLHWDEAYHYKWNPNENKYNVTTPKNKIIVTDKAVRYDKTMHS